MQGPQIAITHKQAVTDVLANQTQVYHKLLAQFKVLSTADLALALAAVGDSIARLSESANRAGHEELLRIQPPPPVVTKTDPTIPNQAEQ